MATTRLTFLYPPLYRSLRVVDPGAKGAWQKGCDAVNQKGVRNEQIRGVKGSRRQEQTLIERRGVAVEGFPGAGGVNGLVEEKRMVKGDEKGEWVDVVKKGNGERGEKATEKHKKNRKAPKVVKDADGSIVDAQAVSAPSSASPVSKPISTSPMATTASPASVSTTIPPGPIEAGLRMPPSGEEPVRPPYLQTPPWVHHFDTYTLVQQVETGGFTTAQSITFMKAVRGLLALNLEVAREGLVSKSDVENESYLFRAACSELKTEVQNNRRARDEEMRGDRTHLQHEADILSQKLTQELLTLKDELKGMFDDRKMGVRSEQRDVESKIQGLNYKITVLLNSDAKSEVEGLRWVLTRRSVMGILFMALMVLTSLRYASYRSHEDEVRKKRDKDSETALSSGGSGNAGREGAGLMEVLAASGG